MPLKKLVDGFNRFRTRYYESGARLMEKLAKDGANPDFFIINCIDPRNGADLVFDAEPGQQFVRSQMAAIIPPYDESLRPEITASLSYAIEAKKIKHIVIMGHSQCGGVAALVDGTSDNYISAWVKTAQKAKQAAEAVVGTGNEAALHRETEQQVIIMSLKNLLEYPMVKTALLEGRLTVNAWFFDLEKGALHEYEPGRNKFIQLSEETPSMHSIKLRSGKNPPPPRRAA